MQTQTLTAQSEIANGGRTSTSPGGHDAGPLPKDSTAEIANCGRTSNSLCGQGAGPKFKDSTSYELADGLSYLQFRLNFATWRWPAQCVDTSAVAYAACDTHEGWCPSASGGQDGWCPSAISRALTEDWCPSATLVRSTALESANNGRSSNSPGVPGQGIPSLM